MKYCILSEMSVYILTVHIYAKIIIDNKFARKYKNKKAIHPVYIPSLVEKQQIDEYFQGINSLITEA